ncbi:MarR family winged helix-turn-helix transcriptional regulator [Umezawaea sp.]|uniref:MarR family winged helix-turn-helix transcriptional regulator n=1 Tax=Umezawaea sp. TaxID=1955258 RepID=UPI002ED3C1C4
MEKRVRETPSDADLYASGPRLPEELTRWPMYVMSRAVQRGWVLLARRLRTEGLNPRLHAVLAVVHARTPISQQAVADLLRIDRTTMIAVVDEAEAADLISRTRDRGDRRRYALRLTAAGERALVLADRLVAEAHAELLGELDEGERAVLHELLLRTVPAADTGYSD